MFLENNQPNLSRVVKVLSMLSAIMLYLLDFENTTSVTHKQRKSQNQLLLLEKREPNKDLSEQFKEYSEVFKLDNKN